MTVLQRNETTFMTFVSIFTFFKSLISMTFRGVYCHEQKLKILIENYKKKVINFNIVCKMLYRRQLLLSFLILATRGQ